MIAARIVIAGALVAAGWAATANSAPRSTGPSPQELVAVRQAGMTMSAASLNLLRGASTNGTALKNLAFPASGLAKWAAAMPAMFADSTKGVPSRATAKVWTQKADFMAKSKAFADSTKALVDAAKADDKPAFDAALASTAASCKGCHDTYQVPPAPPPKAG